MNSTQTVTRVGIVNPNWTVQRHNTDHVCLLDLSRIHQHASGLQMGFVGNRVQYLMANANRVSQRLADRWIFPSIPLKVEASGLDVLYRYGQKAMGLKLKVGTRAPLLSTVGFPSMQEDLALGKGYLAEQADTLERETQDSAVLHFHTDAMRELYLDQKPQERQRCTTVPFYLPHLRFIEEENLHQKFDQQQIRLLFVGADGERKGLSDLCLALDELASDPLALDMSVVVVSRTVPRCQHFKALTHYPSMQRDAVQALMAESHLYCMVPRRESFGLVFVEAMAAGCAVIADDDIPRREILDHGRCGVLLPVQRVDKMVSAIRRFLENRNLMRETATAGWQRAQARYAPLAVAESYVQTFRSMTTETKR